MQNLGGTTLTWGVSKTQSWLELDPEWDTLDPNKTATMRVSLTAAADALVEGIYTDTVTFTNIGSSQADQYRDVTLTVEYYPDVTYHVDGLNGDNGNDGLCRGTALATIQQGIDTSNNGDTILVWPGVYTEDVNFLGKAITVKSAADAAAIVAAGNYAVSFVTGEWEDTVLENFVIRDSYTGIQAVAISISRAGG